MTEYDELKLDYGVLSTAADKALEKLLNYDNNYRYITQISIDGHTMSPELHTNDFSVRNTEKELYCSGIDYSLTVFSDDPKFSSGIYLRDTKKIVEVFEYCKTHNEDVPDITRLFIKAVDLPNF